MNYPALITELIRSIGKYIIAFVCLVLCFIKLINNKLCKK